MKTYIIFISVMAATATPMEDFFPSDERQRDDLPFASEPLTREFDKEDMTSGIAEDVEVFQESKENDTQGVLAKLLRHYDPFNLLQHGSEMEYLAKRARILATIPRQHRSQLFESELTEKKSDRVLAGFPAVEIFNNLRLAGDKPSVNLEECDEARKANLADLQSLALNTSVLEVRVELLEMAQERAERQARSAILDVLECHKHMAVLEYIKNNTESSMIAMNYSVIRANNEALDCKMSKNKLESHMETLEERQVDERLQYLTTKKNLDEIQRQLHISEAEARVLKEELDKKKVEKVETEFKLEALRSNLMELRSNSSMASSEDANLQLDTLESLNDLLVTQMDIMTQENDALKTSHEKEMEQLVQELDECEKAKENAEKKVQYSGELCANSRIDAAMNENSTSVFLFKGPYYWVMSEDEGITDDEPSLINETWPGAPPSVDAAFYSDDQESAFFFHGSQYWQYKDYELLPDFPKEISEGFPGAPDNIVAAFVWKVTGKIYLFKDERYWQSESDGSFTVHGIHARWGGAGWHGGIPHDIDAIFEIDGSTIFLKKDLYYRYSDTSHKIEESVPPYPRLMCTWLFGCPASSTCLKRRRL